MRNIEEIKTHYGPVLIEVYYAMSINTVYYQRIGYQLIHLDEKSIEYFGVKTTEKQQAKMLQLMAKRLEDIDTKFKDVFLVGI